MPASQFANSKVQDKGSSPRCQDAWDKTSKEPLATQSVMSRIRELPIYQLGGDWTFRKGPGRGSLNCHVCLFKEWWASGLYCHLLASCFMTKQVTCISMFSPHQNPSTWGCPIEVRYLQRLTRTCNCFCTLYKISSVEMIFWKKSINCHFVLGTKTWKNVWISG